MEFYGRDYVERTKPQIAAYKGEDGNIKHVTLDTASRKLALMTMCIGQGSILGFLIGMNPFSSSLIPLTLFTCTFSNLGHLIYNKIPKTKYSPTQLFTTGVFTGILGLGLVTSGVFIPFGLNISMQGLEISTYIGLLMYNLFAKYDCQKALEDINKGKGDCLKHASAYSENWVVALFPYFVMNFIQAV